MPIKKIKKHFVTLSAIVMLFACGGGSVLNGNGSANAKDDSIQDYLLSSGASTVSGHYLSASVARNYGNSRDALDYLNEAIGLGNVDDGLYIDAYSLSLSAGDIELAANFANKITDNVDNVILSPKLLQAVVSLKKGDFAKAEKLLNQAQEKGFGQLVVTLLKGWVSYAQNKPVNVSELKSLVQQGGEFELLMKHQLAMLFEVIGDDSSVDYFNDIQQVSYLPYHIVLSLSQHYRRVGDATNYNKLVKRYSGASGIQIPKFSAADSSKVSAKDGAAEVFFSIASLLISVNAIDVAQVPLNIAKYLNDDFTSVDFMQAQVAEKSGDSKKAIKAYKRLETDAAYGVMSSLQLAYLYQAQGDSEAALKQLDKLSEHNVAQLSLFLAKGDILRAEHKYTEAIEAYSDAISTIDEKKAEDWPAFYSRAIAYDISGDWQNAEADFLEALRLQPDQPEVLNYLGYSWIIQNRQLSQAKAMIAKAMKARPRDAHIIDSMGWALYRLGEYDEATIYMERALYLSPGDATINEHMGDIYWRMGYETQARYQWERALSFNPTEKGQVEGLEGKIASGLPAADVPKTDVMHAGMPQNKNDQQRADIQNKKKNPAQ